jgi:hypothetical protein
MKRKGDVEYLVYGSVELESDEYIPKDKLESLRKEVSERL